MLIYSGIYISNFLQQLFGCAIAFMWAEKVFKMCKYGYRGGVGGMGGGIKLICPKIIIIIIICEKLKCEWRTRRL